MTGVNQFSVTRHTKAPMRLEFKSRFRASPQKLFYMLSDQHAFTNWVPLMRAVVMEHGDGGQCGVGSVRHCTMQGMGGIDETILWWDPPHGYAFRVEAQSKMMMPTRDHVAVMLIAPTANGGSELTWKHYFNWRGVVMRHMAAFMLPMMIRKALANMRKELGEDNAVSRVRAMS